MIVIFKAGTMVYTPFVKKKDVDFLEEREIFITDNETNCDVFLGQRISDLLPFIFKYGSTKKYLIWTHEPRWNKCFDKKYKPFWGLPNINIMNVYTGDIYLNNYYTTGRQSNQSMDGLLTPLNEVNFPNFKHKKVVALMLYRNNKWKWSFKKNGKELDLCYLRTKIALEGYNLNKVDIYGRGWPKSISLEDSRGGNWHKRKTDILTKYHFNLCFENTNFDYYCTEKIWDSIRYGCLPIYYGKDNKIYDDFPKNSFLDYCDFKNSKELFKYIDSMCATEFRTRMNLCITVFNEVYKKTREFPFYEQILLRIVERLKAITI